MSELQRAKIEAANKAINTAKAVAKCLNDFPPPLSFGIAACILKYQYPEQCILLDEKLEDENEFEKFK